MPIKKRKRKKLKFFLLHFKKSCRICHEFTDIWLPTPLEFIYIYELQITNTWKKKKMRSRVFACVADIYLYLNSLKIDLAAVHNSLGNLRWFHYLDCMIPKECMTVTLKKKKNNKKTHTHKQNVTSGYYILKRELLKVISLEEHEK